MTDNKNVNLTANKSKVSCRGSLKLFLLELSAKVLKFQAKKG